MLDKSEKIIWMSRTDASWGGGGRGDLIIVPERYLTGDEREVIDNADSTIDDIHDVLIAAEERIHRDTCLCPKDTYKGDTDNPEGN